MERPDDRYELARWIEKEAGPVLRPISVTERHVWVASTWPEVVAFTLTHADGWLR